MFRGKWRVVTVTPAGRRDCLKILIQYLLRNRHIIDKHEFWLNTVVVDDINYIRRATAEYPNFFTIIPPQITPMHADETEWCPYSSSIHPFFEHCIEDDTIYIRIDDDICFFSNGAFDELVKFRIENPQYFLVYPFIINNSMNYLPELFNKIFVPLSRLYPQSARNSKRLDTDFLPSAKLARDRHEDLINNLDNLEHFQFDKVETTDHISINVICWFGSDFATFAGKVQNLPTWGDGEEPWLSTTKPQSLGKNNAICGKAVASHLTFGNQRRNDPNLLPDLVDIYSSLLMKCL